MLKNDLAQYIKIGRAAQPHLVRSCTKDGGASLGSAILKFPLSAIGERRQPRARAPAKRP
jgi:hypothetical protein